MNASPTDTLSPSVHPAQEFVDPHAAVDQLTRIHQNAMKFLVGSYYECVDTVANQGQLPAAIRAYYPELRFTVSGIGEIDPSLSHGFVDREGIYTATITRPVLFRKYLIEQISNLLANHGGSIEVRTSDTPIPLHMCRGYYTAASHAAATLVDPADVTAIENLFTPIDSAAIDDTIADGEADYLNLAAKPLSLFTAPRVDLALQRLEHYTGANAKHIQQFILFTNYQLHTDVFLEYAQEVLNGQAVNGEARNGEATDGSAGENPSASPYTSLVCPGDQEYFAGDVPDAATCRQHAHHSQMPAYHLKRADNNGITIIDIGVGPSNAKTMTDCLAVLRPHCWIMVGHCAGLDRRMRIGDMILANSYDRADQILNGHVPLEKPIPPIAEIQQAITQSLKTMMDLTDATVRQRLRTGTILTTNDRNWEWQSQRSIYRALQKSTAIGVEMESATIATNGYRFRVPYGALLSVSDMPLHNKPKLPQTARQFYNTTKKQHLHTAIHACELLADDPSQLHSRKLRRPVGGGGVPLTGVVKRENAYKLLDTPTGYR